MEVIILVNDVFFNRPITILINKTCANKKKINPEIKNNSPLNINKTSPKKQSSNAIVYHFNLIGNENTYKNISEKRIKGLKTYTSAGILKITPIISKTDTTTKTKKVILTLLIHKLLISSWQDTLFV